MASSRTRLAAAVADPVHRLLRGFASAVIWVYLSEIFPTDVRARGQAIGSATHWILNALIAGAFPIVAAHSKPAPFAFFACMMVLQFIAALL